MSKETKTIIGSGLAGPLLAIFLGQRGHSIHLFEKRSDLRVEKISAGRSINLALSHRGIRALKVAKVFDEIELNEQIKESLNKKPLYHKTILLKLLRIKQVPGAIPTFNLYVNFPQWFGPTQLGFIENRLRSLYDLVGCPIQFNLRRV